MTDPHDPLILLQSIVPGQFPLLTHLLNKPGNDELRLEVARLMAAAIGKGHFNAGQLVAMGLEKIDELVMYYTESAYLPEPDGEDLN